VGPEGGGGEKGANGEGRFVKKRATSSITDSSFLTSITTTSAARPADRCPSSASSSPPVNHPIAKIANSSAAAAARAAPLNQRGAMRWEGPSGTSPFDRARVCGIPSRAGFRAQAGVRRGGPVEWSGAVGDGRKNQRKKAGREKGGMKTLERVRIFANPRAARWFFPSEKNRALSVSIPPPLPRAPQTTLYTHVST